MQTIFKYPFQTTDRFNIHMPKGAKIITVATQNENPCMWAIIDPATTETEKRYFRVFGTGHVIEDGYIYNENLFFRGTYQLQGGALVFHLFEVL
jgi:hypothetical protein